MDLKMWECERETRTEEEQSKEVDISVHIIVLTLGTFLLMVCLKKFLVEQWRAWVFLVLNVILLAILFMSMKPNFWGQSSESGERSVGEEVKSDKKVKENNEEGNKECIKKSQCWGSSSSSSTYANVNVDVDVENKIIDEEEEEQVLVLSKEELNERVEAFIAMFRQHLISDVKESEDFRFQKTANFANKIQVPCC